MNFNLKQEIHGLGHMVVGVVIVALVVAGIGGTIYKVIAPDGWVAMAFGRSTSAGVAALGSLLLVGLLAWLSRTWQVLGRRNRFSDLLVFTFAAAGMLYLAKLWMKGIL